MTGILLLLAAGLFWSLNGALIKLINDGGRGPGGVTIALYRSLFAGLFLVPMARGRFHTLRVGPTFQSVKAGPTFKSVKARPTFKSVVQQLCPVRTAAVACVFFFTLMTVCFVVANTKTTAANAIILQYTSTFWIFGLSPWLLRENPRPREFGLLALAMLGIAVIFVGNAATSLPGLIIALASGLFFGLLTLMIRQLRDTDSAAVTVLNNLGSAALLLPVGLLVGGLTLSPREWLLLIVMGVVQFGLPYYLYALGLARVAAYKAALLTMIEPVLVPVWTYLAVGETVPATTLIGAALILVALIAFLRGTPSAVRAAPPPA
jgi:drug/metabolite transporter (DMT)-like permease